jgi:transposase
VKELRRASEPEALAAALHETQLPLERIGLEACALTAWLCEGLRQAGLPAICIETRQAKAAMKAMPNKTDRNDARALAQIMRTGWYREVHVKSRQCRLWRSLLVARRRVLNEMRTIENVVRAIPREAGLKLGTPPRAAFAARVRELAGGDTRVMALIEPLPSVLATMRRALAGLTKQVLDIVRREEVCRRFLSAPGVGPLTALACRATIDRPERFHCSRAVGAHLGLTPARYQSGETDIQGQISRCGDELARTALYEAAHTLLVRSRKWSSLRAWGLKIAKRRGMARARVAVARKLAVILHRMWCEGTEFRFGKEPGAPAGRAAA